MVNMISKENAMINMMCEKKKGSRCSMDVAVMLLLSYYIELKEFSFYIIFIIAL